MGPNQVRFHAGFVAKLETIRQLDLLPTWKTTPLSTAATVSSMGTSPKATVLRYFIKEWAVELKKSDEDMADCMGYAQRSGVWKLYKNQNRINPAKAAKAAQCLGISVRQLQFPPDVPSLDDMAEGASPEQRALMIADIARRMRR